MLRAAFLAAVASVALGAGSARPVVRPPSAARVTVLLSQDELPYRQAVQGFQEQLRRSDPSAVVVIYVLAPGGEREMVSRIRVEAPTLVLALGTAATNVARRVGTVPVVVGMVLQASDVLQGPQFTGVSLAFPAQVEFRFLKRILPGQRRVAVLYNATENQESIEEAGRAARAAGLDLLARSVPSPSDIPSMLESVSQADVLWGLADTMVLTRETARTILLFSIKHRIPFIGLSAPWAKAGAVYALERDYVDIGRQCAELAALVLDGGLPAALPPVPPRKVLYFINQRVATQLQLTIPREVLRGAEQVFE